MKGQGGHGSPQPPPNYYFTQLKRNQCSVNRRNFGLNTWVVSIHRTIHHVILHFTILTFKINSIVQYRILNAKPRIIVKVNHSRDFVVLGISDLLEHHSRPAKCKICKADRTIGSNILQKERKHEPKRNITLMS